MPRQQEIVTSTLIRGPKPEPLSGQDDAARQLLHEPSNGTAPADRPSVRADAGNPRLRLILGKAGELTELIDAFLREEEDVPGSKRGRAGVNAGPEFHPDSPSAAAVAAATERSNGAGGASDRSLFDIAELNEADGEPRASERGGGGDHAWTGAAVAADLTAQMLRLRDALGDARHADGLRTEVFRLAGNMTTYKSIAFIKTCKCPGSAAPTFSVAKKGNGLMGLVMGLVRLLEAVSSQRCGCQAFQAALAQNGDALASTAAEVCRIAEDSEPVLRKLSHGDLIARVHTVCQKIKGILDEILSDGTPKGASATLKSPRATQFNIGMAGKAPDLSVKLPEDGCCHVHATPCPAAATGGVAQGATRGAGVYHGAYNVPSRGRRRHQPCGTVPGHVHRHCQQ